MALLIGRFALLLVCGGYAAVIDLRYHRIPNAVPGTLAVVGLALAAAGGWVALRASVEGALLAAVFWIILCTLFRFGWGDGKFAVAAALVTGPSVACYATAAALLLGAVFGLALLTIAAARGGLAAARGAARSFVPFGPALATAYVATFLLAVR